MHCGTLQGARTEECGLTQRHYPSMGLCVKLMPAHEYPSHSWCGRMERSTAKPPAIGGADGINNRVEVSHLLTRQRVLEPFGPIRQHFYPRRRCAAWNEITSVAP